MEKRLTKKPNCLTTKIMNIGTKGGWKEKTEEIKNEINQTKNNTQSPTTEKQNILSYFQEKILSQAQEKSKVQNVLNNKQWTAGKRPEYMNKLTQNGSINNIQSQNKNARCKKTTSEECCVGCVITY